MNRTKHVTQKKGGGLRRSGAPVTDKIYRKGGTDASQKSMPRVKRWDDTGEKG